MVSTAAIIGFNVAVLAATLVIMTLAGGYFVEALSSYARKLGMSKYFIGMVVVAVATSSPDIITSIMGLLAGEPEILSGVVLGGLVLDVAFLNGWFAFLGKRLELETDVIKGIEYVVLGLLLLPFILMIDGELGRSEGIAMVLSFIIYVMLIWSRESKSGRLKKDIPVKRIWQDALVFLFALAAMLISGRYAVLSATTLSTLLNIPIFILAVTVLAFAAAAPDFLAGTLAIVRGKGGEIGFGEAIGTTMIEINLFAGLVAIIQPLKLGFMSVIGGLGALIIGFLYFMALMKHGTVTWKHGIAFMAIYAAFLTFEFTRVFWWGA